MPGRLSLLGLVPALLLSLPLALAQAPASGAPQPPADTFRQFTHRSWTEESDAPRPVLAIAQGKRGYLWVAASTGLFRFDGSRFDHISAGVDPLVHGPPSALLVRRNGDVWTSFERSGQFAVYRGGRLMFLKAPPAPGRVAAMREAADGTIWILTERIGLPLLRYKNGRWTQFGVAAGAPLDNPFSMVVSSDGTVWLSFTGSIARLSPGSSQLETVRKAPRSLGRLSIDPQERIWLTERNGSYPITGAGGRGNPPRLRHPYATDTGEIRGWPIFDRQGNLWIATYYDGLQRVRRPDPRGAASRSEAHAQVEHFRFGDGLSSNVTSQVYQDAEGNIWSGTENGLDRFWPATVRSEPELTDPAAFGDILLTASDGSVYIGEAGTVYRVQPGGRPEPIFTTAVEPRTLCEAPDGAIWIGLDREVAIWRKGGIVRRLATPAPVTSTIYDCAFDASGAYWVTASLGGMARFRAGRWERMFEGAGPDFLPKSMVNDARGRIIFQWNDDHIATIDGSTRRRPIPVGDYEADETFLHAAPNDTLFAGGRFGLVRLRDGRFARIAPERVPQLSGLSGMVEADGASWLAGPAGILRLRTSDLDQAFNGARRPLAMQIFGTADGLKSLPHDHSRRSIVRGGDGRLWIATQSGTQWLDPAAIARSKSAPGVAISALTADRTYRDPIEVRLPAGASNIQIDFAVFAFSNPRSARARYRIVGQDRHWIDAGTRRQAFYTNLAPGTYRFQLMAANEEGTWEGQGAELQFTIPPTFFQSWWFVALCAGAAILLLALAYRLRVARVSARIRSRLAERLGERERIARELHDTLLQSVQGLILRFQSVANIMPEDGSSRARLEEALKRADEVIAEGRDRVQELRAADGPQDLPELLRQRASEAGFNPDTSVRIVVEGRQRPVHPLILTEVGRIAAEALFNAARHASANRVEIAVRFGLRDLTVEVADDGVGIDADVLDRKGRPGHFGLVGMRERAERIGASFDLQSEPDGGSLVTVGLPASLAYADASPRRRIFPWGPGGERSDHG